MMIEDIIHTWMQVYTPSGKLTNIVSYKIPPSDIVAQISLSDTWFVPTGSSKSFDDCLIYARATIPYYIVKGKQICNSGNCPVYAVNDCDSIDFLLDVWNGSAAASALIFFKAKPPTFTVKRLATLAYVIYDPLTGNILHKHATTVLQGATELSKAQVEQEAIDSASRIHDRPKSQLSALFVKDDAVKFGFEYKVDTKKKTLQQTKR
jgi:hypothetical protein